MTPFRLPLLVLLSVLAVLFAAACGDDDDEDVDEPGSTTVAAFATDTPVPGATTPVAQPTENANCPAPSGDAPEPDVSKQYDAEPPMTIDPAKTYTAVLRTVRGDITINLRPDLAPHHVNSFVFLAREGYFNGVTFHRVLPGFVAQTGDPTGSGNGGPGYAIALEATTEVAYQRGTVGMARTNDPNSAGSQFFINYAATPSLDGQYTIFGEVTSGMEVVDCITPRDPSSNPSAPAGDAIISVDVTES